jgi:hypothetical protein
MNYLFRGVCVRELSRAVLFILSSVHSALFEMTTKKLEDFNVKRAYYL